MGYYTDFRLEASDGKDYYDELVQITNYPFAHDTVKWYDYQTDMRRFSMRYPQVLFTLMGIGEEPGDMWVAYFKDGLMQWEAAEITYPDFDKYKLE